MKDELAKRLVQGIKHAGIDFVTYLPETRLSQIIPLIQDDPEMELIAAASEQEAVTIAAGATLGGKQAAVYMENTGIYVSSYSLLTVGKQLGVPIKLSETPGAIRTPPPFLSQDTARVLSEDLGLDSATIDRLRHEGAI